MASLVSRMGVGFMITDWEDVGDSSHGNGTPE